MELDKNESYRALIRECSEVVRQYGLHSCDGPVNLKPILEDPDINITVIYQPLENGLHGYAITDPEDNIPPHIVINSSDSPELQAETLAHELVHLVKHAHERLHYWWDGIADSTQEIEALHGAAYLKVPLGYLIEMTREGHKPEVIAAELGVRKELVELRWRMAVQFDELRYIFDEVDCSKNTTKRTQNNIITFSPIFQEITNSEVELLGRAVQRESIKVPIGEVQSYLQPKVIHGTFKDGTTYTIGDPAGLDFWESLERNYDEEEL